MKIQRVKITEFKCLKDIDQAIDGANVLLVGDNAVGKSSFIQAIQCALGDKRAIPPATTGEALIVFDKDGKEYSVTVNIDDGKAKIIVTSNDGMRDTRKGVLAELTGAIDFDINEFVELSKSDAGRKKQVEIFKQFLPSEAQYQINALERDIERDFNQRTELNRQIKYVEGALESLRCQPCEEPESTSDLSKKLSEATTVNNSISNSKKRLNEVTSQANDITEEIKRLESRRQALGIETAALKKTIENTQEIDIIPIEQAIKESDIKRQSFNNYQNYVAKAKEFNWLQAQSGELTNKIESSRTKLIEVVKSAKTPISGLSFVDGNLLYNGVPVSENSLSTSEIMQLGFLLKMAENPDLGILFVQRAESLGKEKFAALLELAKKNNVQLIIEQVQRGTETLQIEIFS